MNLTSFNCTDLGNAHRLVHQHGSNLRYCHSWGTWFFWNGKFWERDNTGEIDRLSRRTLNTFYQQSMGLDDADARIRCLKWRAFSESFSRLNAMIKLAQSEAPIYVSHHDLDRNPWLLNVGNGTLNLETGELQPFSRGDLLTHGVSTHYDPEAKAPNWELFLSQIIPDDEMRKFVKKSIGYSLTGLTSEQCLFFLWGLGSNGKTTFVEVIKALLGVYGWKSPSTLVMHSKQRSIPNDIARLPGKRFVVMPEVEEGERLAESQVKELTGGDTLVARFLHQEWFEFSPTHKLWIYGNYKPTIRGTDEGIWRRIRLVPFTVHIPKEQRDPHLRDRLLKELSGILTWAVQGCEEWKETGLGTPQKIDDAVQEYKSSMDELGEFLEEVLIWMPGSSIVKGDLFSIYKARGGELSKRNLTNAMRRRGFEDGHGNSNTPIWMDVKFKSEAIPSLIIRRQAQVLFGDSLNQNWEENNETSDGGPGDIEH